MSQGKKYSYHLIQKGDSWSAEILRQASHKKTVVSKRQGDFKTEAEAEAWAEQTLKGFLEQQVERNKRKSEKRTLREENEAGE
ncbi:MAG: DUF3622 domain-containing protein [Neptuniibacter sp.]